MNCLICKNPTTVIHDSQFDLDYDCCPECGFIGQDRDNLISFVEERTEYDRHENSIDNEGYVNYFKKFINNALVPFIDSGHGLDYGSGPEPVMQQVLRRDYALDVDIYDLHYQTETVFEGKTYDYILSTEVIEHVQQPLEVLQLFYNHLKPGGILALMTLFHQDSEKDFLQWWYRRDVTHISFFLPKTFQKMAQLIGFEIIFCDAERMITLKKPV